MTDDTGRALRALYAPDGGVGAIFTGKVADYVASRPGYPAPLFELLRAACPPTAGAVVADIGAGTGLLTQGLLAAGYRVVAVEPNADMRRAADSRLGARPGYRSADGSAEAQPFDDGSLDLITAAQAFHWFDVERARNECLRVLRPHGQVALIWNDRVLADPLHAALDDVFAAYGGERRGALVAHEERRDVPRFFGAGRSAEHAWANEHLLDEGGLLALVFSRSYMPARESAAGREAAQRVGAIFRQFAAEGVLAVRYVTVAIVGRPQ